ncbi:hypothetical protein [Pseudofrankia sp. DC12]|uniref:hypothetical protein n=1 Tax=Pseudofrankia sp. DC12 TaxID=683315 RepID=UPI000698F9A8|nr:hypothetical protein [Pseudofrankia sp. DC12]
MCTPNPSPEERAAWDRSPAREHPLVWNQRSGRRSPLLGSTAGEVVGAFNEAGLALARPPAGTSDSARVCGTPHRALPYGEGFSRLMHRTSIVGDEAIA